MRAAAPRVVLDTNVCLDLLVFASDRSAPLRALLDAGSVRAVTRADCRDEWRRVLGYRALARASPDPDALLAAYDALCEPIDTPAIAPTAHLPRCSDPDDQKFLELARDAGAAVLFTRDAALLALARRCRRDGLFAIAEPAAVHDVLPRFVAA